MVEGELELPGFNFLCRDLYGLLEFVRYSLKTLGLEDSTKVSTIACQQNQINS